METLSYPHTFTLYIQLKRSNNNTNVFPGIGTAVYVTAYVTSSCAHKQNGAQTFSVAEVTSWLPGAWFLWQTGVLCCAKARDLIGARSRRSVCVAYSAEYCRAASVESR